MGCMLKGRRGQSEDEFDRWHWSEGGGFVYFGPRFIIHFFNDYQPFILTMPFHVSSFGLQWDLWDHAQCRLLKDDV